MVSLRFLPLSGLRRPFVYCIMVIAFLPGGMISALAQRTPDPDFPPGVSRPRELPNPAAIPPQVFIDSLEIDWTDSRLRTSLAIDGKIAGGPDLGSARNLEDPAIMRIHLSAPEPASDQSRLTASPARVSSAAGNGGEVAVRHPRFDPPAGWDERNLVHIGGIAPWTFTGPGVATQPGWDGALAVGAASVALTWLGTADAWVLNPPTFRFGEKIILSSLNPLTGRGSFHVVRNRTGRPLELSALTPWVRGGFQGQHLIAVHGDGPDVGIRQGAWRLAGPGGTPARGAAGAVLLLRKSEPGEREDLARIHDARITASSYEFAYAPSQTISGRLWPVALRPPIWMSREQKDDSEHPWLELELDRVRRVEEICLVHAGAAGWSADFNPAGLRIELRNSREFDSPRVLTIEPEGEVSTIRFADPLRIQSLRIEFPAPTGFDLPAVARLMAIQVYGRDSGSDGR